MRNSIIVTLLVTALLMLGVAVHADGPPDPIAGKLYGVLYSGGQPDVATYDKSGLTAAFVSADWSRIQPAASSTLVFSSLDSQPYAKSKKTTICRVFLANPWADSLRIQKPAEYAKQALAFGTALANHGKALGITHYWLVSDRNTPTAAYLASLRPLYKGIKLASKESVVIAGTFDSAAVESFYALGGKDFFDCLAINPGPADARRGVSVIRLDDAFQAIAAHETDQKPILLDCNWGQAATPEMVNLAYRSIQTARDTYHPGWVLGAAFRADAKTNPKLISSFAKDIPSTTLTAQLSGDSPVISVVAGVPQKVTLTANNPSAKHIDLNKFSMTVLSPEGAKVEVKPEGTPTASIQPGASGTADFTVTLPADTIGEEVVLAGELDYTVDGRKEFVDSWMTVLPTVPIEVNLLPSRLLLGAKAEPVTTGMSVISHENQTFTGKIVLRPQAGLTVVPSEKEMKVDPLSLEAMVFKVNRDPNLAPGHYAVYIDVGDKAKDWLAVEVPVVSKKVTAVNLDGKLDDWKDATGVDLKVRSGDSWSNIGKAYFANDADKLYIALEVNDAAHQPVRQLDKLADGDSVRIGFDPLVNGLQPGGAKDDLEYALADVNSKPVVVRTVCPDGMTKGPTNDVKFVFKQDGDKSIYEMAFPIAGFGKVRKDRDTGNMRMLAMSIGFNQVDGSTHSYVQWGGGLGDKTDPRQFVPVILAD